MPENERSRYPFSTFVVFVSPLLSLGVAVVLGAIGVITLAIGQLGE